MNKLLLFIYSFKIYNRRARKSLKLSEVHKNTQIYTIQKITKDKKNKKDIKHIYVSDVFCFHRDKLTYINNMSNVDYV